MDTQWFLTRNGETIAQYSTEQFKQAVANRVLRPADYVRRSDSSTLISAAEFLPATYQPRSAAPRVLGQMVLLALALGAVAFTVSAYLPSMQQTLSRLEEASRGAGVPAGGSNTGENAVWQTVQTEPFYKALQEKDPAAYNAMIVYVQSITASEQPADMLPKLRAYVDETVLKPRLLYLSDDARLTMLTLNRDITLELANTDPKLCIKHALGTSPGEVFAAISPAMRARDDDFRISMLDATPQTYDLLPPQELQALNAKVGTALYAKHGNDVGLLDLQNVAEGKEQAACQMFAAYLDGVLTLPDADRIALVRAMMLEPQRLAATETAPAAPAEAADAMPQDANAAPDGAAPAAQPESDIPFPDGAQRRK
jgi:hypothetical protein